MSVHEYARRTKRRYRVTLYRASLVRGIVPTSTLELYARDPDDARDRAQMRRPGVAVLVEEVS